MGNRVDVEIGITGYQTAENILNNFKVEVNQFVSTVNRAEASAARGIGSYLERFAIRQLMLGATREVENFFASSVKAAREAERAEAVFNGQILATAQSYQTAKRAAEEFHNYTRSTSAQASEATASTASIAARAGLTSSSDALIQKSVADIVAAQGGGAAETVKALQKLAGGGGEIIEQLTGRSAAETERAYALLNNRLPKDLTEMEKSVAHVNAVIDAGKLFNGEAANRLDTVAGRVEQNANRWEEYKASVGEAILSSAQLKEVLDGLVGTLAGLPGAARKGFRSVNEAGREADAALDSGLGGGLKSLYNHVELGAKVGVATLGSIFSGDLFTERGRAGYYLAEQYRDDILNRDRINAEELQAATNRETRNREVSQLRQGGISQADISDLFKRASQYAEGPAREQFIDSEIDRLLKGVEQARIAAEKARQESERDIRLQKGRFERAIAEANRTENLEARIRQLTEQRAQVARLPGSAFDPNDKESLTGRIDADVQSARKALAALRAQSVELFDTLSAKVAHDNPFLKLASDSDRSITQIRERFKGLGDESVEQLVRMQRAADAVALSNLRIQTSLKAVELEFQAERLQHGYVGITAEQQRQLGIFERRFQAAANAPALRREAEAFERGFVVQNPFELRREQVADYERIKRLRPEGVDEAARAGQKLIDDYIIEATRGLSVGARFSPDVATRQAAADRAAALRARASRFEAEVQDEIERAQAGRFGVELANRKLSELARLAPGADPNLIRQEFLGITKALDPKELTGALKEATVIALKEEARYQRGIEDEARNFRAHLLSPTGILYQIKDAIVSLKPGMEATRAHEEATRTSFDEATPTTTPGALRAYAQSLNAESRSPAPLSEDDIVTLLREKAAGRLALDIASISARPQTGVEVNPYTQELFRARPHFSHANDPREFNPHDPSMLDTLRREARSNYHAQAQALRDTMPPYHTQAAQEARATGDVLTVLRSIEARLASLESGIKAGVDVNASINATFNVSDDLSVDSVSLLGGTPKPDVNY